ncbi:glutathione S-transferase family protein [Rhizorhabdus argentea]|uniref:glutathione S-transferase family protein n=1 Tax=Rhizorhabdus argentea TaxID=1387174 RepID=UPI0030ED88F5
MLKLYHCRETRSLRPLWALEEMGIPYEPVMLPFPPRALAREYLDINPIGTIPFLVDGEVRMTESTAICLYLTTRYGPTPLALSPDERDYPLFLNWLFYSDATLTFPQTIVLRYRQLEAPENRAERPAADYEKWFNGRLRAVESALADREWLCAGRFTIADIAIAYALYLADRVVGLGANFGPNVRAYLDRACARAGFKRASIVDSQAPAWR